MLLAQFAHKFLCLFAILTVLPFVAGPNGQQPAAGFPLDSPELHSIQREPTVAERADGGRKQLIFTLTSEYV